MESRDPLPEITPLRFRAACLLLLASFAFLAHRSAIPEIGYLPGDAPYYGFAAESLARDGDLELRNQLGVLEPHQCFFALAPDGRIVPKHSTLMAIAAVPSFVAFGIFGFLLFNLVQLGLLAEGLARLAGNDGLGRALALAALLLSPLAGYAYNFSPDLFGTLLVTWAFVAANSRRWIATALLSALAVWAKIYLAAVVLPVGLIAATGGWKAVPKFALALAIGLVPMLLVNVHLYGHPLHTGYQYEARLDETGHWVAAGHDSRFNQPFWPGLANLLFDREHGLLATCWLWGLWPVGAYFAWKRSKLSTLGMAASLVINIVLFAKYDEWSASSYGNRFLFPALILGFAIQSELWRIIVARYRPCSSSTSRSAS